MSKHECTCAAWMCDMPAFHSDDCLAKPQPLRPLQDRPSCAREMATHHLACDCREAEFAETARKLAAAEEKLRAAAGAFRALVDMLDDSDMKHWTKREWDVLEQAFVALKAIEEES